jgi:probable F420-dependent oxidoreductase
VNLGLIMFPTRDAIRPAELGALLEERGFESLFLPDHTHIPARTPEVVDLAGLPDEFRLGMDCLVALGAVAQATTTLTIGTAVALLPERDPIVTAKQVATIDVLSGGRMQFGIGPGWIYQEMRNHGVRPEDRFRVTHERILAMREIWTNDVASYRGSFVSFEDVTSWPKPVQQPHPPILVAGNGPRVAERVVAYGDEWIPMRRPGVLEAIAEFKRNVRRPDTGEPYPVTLFGGELAELDAYERAGIDRVLFWPRPLGPGDMAGLLDRIARTAGRHLA